MTRQSSVTLAGLVLFGLVAGLAAPQAPPGKGDGKAGPFFKGKGPPPFELGRVLPPPLREQLRLTPEQQRALDALEKDVAERLNRILSAEQKRLAESFRPGGPPPEAAPPPERPTPRTSDTRGPRLLIKAPLRLLAHETKTYALSGDVLEGELGDPGKEHAGRGIRLLSAQDVNNDGSRAGAVSWTISGARAGQGRWFRFRVRGLAQEGFRVDRDDLFLRVEFFKDREDSLDSIKKTICEQVEADRVGLADRGVNRNVAAATWRSYGFDFRTPFPEVDTLRLSVGFANGAGKGARAEFWVGEVELLPIPDPAEYERSPKTNKAPPALDTLVKLGGRWFYDPRGESRTPPPQFDQGNVDRLHYLAGRLEAPFAGNTTAWLRRGYLDQTGKLADQDRFISDNVIVSFTETHLVIRSRNLPNHPTAVFPDRWRLLDGNPNYIQEQTSTWHIPLEPRENPKHVAMDEKNTNKALALGPIGVAVNGIVFLNPFDESNEHDALWRLDRCCGHPSPGQRYHYHKYPVCLNTPWLDDGHSHSPLIGFAFDGFPIYGPYEAAGELARDSKNNPLNEFNVHHDADRGWHYHVTPGRFPHVIGGFWGMAEPRNLNEKKGPRPFPKKKFD